MPELRYRDKNKDWDHKRDQDDQNQDDQNQDWDPDSDQEPDKGHNNHLDWNRDKTFLWTDDFMSIFMSFPKIRKKQKESQNYEKLIPNQDFDHKRDQDQHHGKGQDRAKTFLLIVFIRLRILRGNFQKECHKLVFYSSTKIQRRPRIDQDDDQDFAHDRG